MNALDPKYGKFSLPIWLTLSGDSLGRKNDDHNNVQGNDNVLL